MNNSDLVCVAIEETYTDNNGPQTAFIFFNTKTKEFSNEYANGYTKLSFDSFSIDATFDQRLEASKAHKEQSKTLDWEVNLMGCVVTLQRSRKAPNKKPLKVIGFNESYYNGSYYTNETIDLLNEDTGEEFFNISTNCVKDVLQGVKKDLWWYVTEADRPVTDVKIDNNSAYVVPAKTMDTVKKLLLLADGDATEAIEDLRSVKKLITKEDFNLKYLDAFIVLKGIEKGDPLLYADCL